MSKISTIKDIADALKVSTSTVSRALRDSHEISQKTKDKVLKYAKEVNFTHNAFAVSLKMGRSNSIGVLICDVTNPFIAQLIDGIESVANQTDYHIMISQSHDEHERELNSLANLMQKSIDGLIISVAGKSKNHQHLSDLQEKGFPLVFVDRVVKSIKAPKITSNNYEASFQATEFLIKKGCKRIVHLGPAKQLYIAQERNRGYLGALKKHHIPIDERYIKYCDFGGKNIEELENILENLLQMKERPDAIFISSDRLSHQCLMYLKKIKKDQELALAGFCNTELVELFSPEFSYIRQPGFEMGKASIQTLINLIEEKNNIGDLEQQTLTSEFFEYPKNL
ncbi:MAG: LacI family DNA-binding transcriptional regulator [Pelobium sp.]